MRRVVGLTVGIGLGLLVWAGPAAAKFWAFELDVQQREIEAGGTIVLDVSIAPELAAEAAASPDIVPPVDVYRTADLPMTGAMTGDEKPAATPTFRSMGEGRFRGEVELTEPGSYQIVSMFIWNHEVEGYPAPIPVTVVAAGEEPLATPAPPAGANGGAGISPLIPGGALVALAATTLLWRSRRGSPTPASS